MTGYKHLREGKQASTLPSLPEDPAAPLTNDEWNRVEQFVNQYATANYPSAPSRYAEIELAVRHLMRGLRTPTYESDAEKYIQKLYNQCQTAATQAHVIAPLLKQDHRVLLRQTLESQDDHNKLG